MSDLFTRNVPSALATGASTSNTKPDAEVLTAPTGDGQADKTACPSPDSLRTVLRCIANVRMNPAQREKDVRFAVQWHLAIGGIFFDEEVVVGPGSRVDILTSDGIAIELKKGKPSCRLVEGQVKRYCDSPMVSAVVLVSERGLMNPPIKEHNGKQIIYVALSTNWGF